MKKKLAKQFPNCVYVAIYKGKPVLAGNDLLDLGNEFYKHFGMVQGYIGKLRGKEDEVHIYSGWVQGLA
ncbi:MAG: hypothetical protein ABSE73_00860 [Planctomycetota bacterium]